MTSPVQIKTRRHLAFLFCVPLAFSLLFFIANQAADHSDVGLLQLQNLSSSINGLLSLSKDIETGERGFLLTGDESYLVPLQQANASLPTQIDLCRTYSKEKPAYTRDVEQLIQLAQKRFVIANKVLEAQRTDSFAAALDLVRGGTGQQTMTQLRSRAYALTRLLDREQNGYLDQQRSLNRFAFLFFLFGTVVMILVLLWLYNALMGQIHGQDTAQAELQALNTDLEHRIDQRTRELKEMNEELQQFAYVASHDLQEPLRTITSFTQLLAARYKDKLDEDADEFIGYIVTSSRRMTDLINGLLTLVRLRKTGLPTVPVALDELLNEAELSLQASIRESGAQIVHGPLPSLVVDKVQMTQLLQNLISNAIKYRRDESPNIYVSAQLKASDWVIAVKDNGQGFDQQYAERIFAIFQRLHGRDVDGTGMGLAISRKIVERHGGRIWAESKPGEGSTFYFSLPASLETSREAEAQQEPAPIASKAGI